MSDAGTPALSSITIKNPYAADVAGFIGEVARPVGLLLLFASTAWGFINKADATALGLMIGGCVALYGAKGAEKIVQTRADADVKKTQAVADSGAPIIDTSAVAAAADKQIKAADKQTEAADTQMAAANKTKETQ
jgi:hypothetical protein